MQSIIPDIRFQIRPGQGAGKLSGGHTELVLKGEHVFVNGVPAAAYREKNAVYWEREEEKGCLWMYYNGLAAHGFVERGGEREELSLRADDAQYSLSYTNGRNEKITVTFIMGTRNNPETGGYLLYGKLMLGDTVLIESFPCDGDGNILSGQMDNGFLKTTFSGTGGCLHAELDLSSRWVLDADTVHETLGESFNIWSAQFDFSADYTTVSGEIYEQRTSGGVTKKGTKYKLSGRAKEQKECMPDTAFVMDEKSMDGLKEAFNRQGGAPRSLTELYTLPAPNMADANKSATQTLYYLAAYYVADKIFPCHGTDIRWSSWFGLKKEKAKEMVIDIDARILDLTDGDTAVKEVQDFLVKYAEACLASSYAGSEDQELDSALDGAKKRLKDQYAYCKLPDLCSFYLQGDAETSLVNDPGYSIAMEEINKYTYAKLTPGLSKYIGNKTEDWAGKLYRQCMKNLTQLKITAISGSAGSSEVSHKSMMLTILDDREHEIADGVDGKNKVSMTYGAALYAKVFNLQLAELADSLGVGFTSAGGTDFVKMMRQIYSVIWEELQKETSDYFSADILKQLQELKKEYDRLDAEEFVQSCVDMTEAGMKLISNGKTLAALIPKLSSLSQKPWASYSATVCSIVFYATSMAGLSTVFMNWEQNTPAEKAEAILVCVQGVANIAVSAVKINDIRVLINPASTFDEKVNASLRLRFDGEEMTTIKGLAETNGTEFDIAMQDMGKKYSTSVTTREAESYQVSRATKYFRIAEIVVRALNVLMMGFMTVMAAVEISKEAKSGGYSTSVCLEIVSTSLMALSCICEAVVFVGDLVGMACSVLPVIGAVAALIGIVFQIVAGALRKPVNPLAEFIKNVLVPFLNSLVIPGRDWVEAHGKQLQTA